MFVAPDAELDDGQLDVVYMERTSKATFVRKVLPKVFKGEHVKEPSVHVAARGRGAGRRRPALHGLRRRRPGRRAADDLPRPAGRPAGAAAGMTLLDVKVAAARAAGALSRRTGRGGTSLPGKLLMRLEPHAIGRLAARLERGSAVISATNGKTTTAAMAAGILERAGAHLVHNRAGANMAGGVAAALMSGPRDGDTGLFEVDEFWLGQVVEELRPRALLLANLFRDQLDRYGELDSIADRWAAVAASTPAALVLNADDPTVADLGRVRDDRGDAGCATRRGRPTSASRTTRWPCRRCSTPPTPRTAGAAARPTATTPSTWATSAATTATTAARRAPNRRSAPATSCSKASAGRASRCPRRPASARSRCRCPASTTSTTRSGQRRWRSRWGRPSTTSTPACTPSPPPSAAPRRCASPGASCRSCSSRTRPAPTRSCARSRSRPASTTSSPRSTTTSPTGAT